MVRSSRFQITGAFSPELGKSRAGLCRWSLEAGPGRITLISCDQRETVIAGEHAFTLPSR